MASYGKWSEPDIPHNGWTCTYVEDLEEPDAICEMCERQEIRYVHYMVHPEYPGEIAAGCICAGRMEEDYKAARRREQPLRKKARQRTQSLKKWRISARGNPYINMDNINAVIFPKGAGWAGRIIDNKTGKKIFSRRPYANQTEIKLHAYDAIAELKELRSIADR